MAERAIEASATPAGSAGARRPSRAFAIYALVVLAGTVFLNALDQTVLPAVVSGIATEFHLSDTAVGLLLGAFVLALAAAAIPVGNWADRGPRRTIIAVGVAVWSLATLITGLTQTFAQMLAARAVVGVGEASSQPAGTSLLGDYFPTRSRGRAMAVLIVAAGLGTGGGLILGGVVGQHFGWRAAFFFAGPPGLVFAALALTIREPLRGAAERSGPKVEDATDAGLAGLRRLLRIRTYVLLLIAGTIGLFAQGTGQLVQLYLHRRFGLEMAKAGSLTGGPLLLGAVVGTPLFGWVIDVRTRRSARGPVEVALVALLACGLAAVVMFSASSIPVFAVGALVFGVAQWAFVLAPFVIVQSIVMPSMRARAVALMITTGRLLGSAAGPVLVGVMSDRLGSNLGLSLLLLTPTALFVSAGCLALALGSIKRDAEQMQVTWASRTSADERPVGRLDGVEPSFAASRA